MRQTIGGASASLGLVVLVLLAACSPFRQGRTIEYEVIDQAAPELPNNGGEPRLSQPLTLVLPGDGPQPALPKGLPVMARDRLTELLFTADDALYIVIYAGVRPTGGYEIEIAEILVRDEEDRQVLTVDYTLHKPAEGDAVAQVLTQPYIIARVAEMDVPPGAVAFKGPLSP